MGQETIVTPSVTLTERFESNPSFEEGKDNDWDAVAVISPQIDFARSSGKSNLNGSLGAGFEYFADSSDLNNERYNASLNLNTQLSSKTTFTITESFSFSPDTLRSPSETANAGSTGNTGVQFVDTGIQVTRTDIMTNNIAFSLIHSLSPSVDAGLTYSNNITEYDDPSLIDTNSNSFVPFINFSKELRVADSPRTTVNGSYNYTRYSFDGNDRGAHSAMIGLKHNYSRSVSLTLSVGAVYTSENGFHFDVIGDTGLTKSTEKSTMSLVYSRRVSTSGLSDDLGITQGVNFNVTTTPTRSFSISMNAGVNSTKSETSGAVDIVTYNAGISGAWQLNQWVNLGAGYFHFQQESDGTRGSDLTRDSVFISVKFVPVVWKL